MMDITKKNFHPISERYISAEDVPNIIPITKAFDHPIIINEHSYKAGKPRHNLRKIDLYIKYKKLQTNEIHESVISIKKAAIFEMFLVGFLNFELFQFEQDVIYSIRSSALLKKISESGYFQEEIFLDNPISVNHHFLIPVNYDHCYNVVCENIEVIHEKSVFDVGEFLMSQKNG